MLATVKLMTALPPCVKRRSGALVMLPIIVVVALMLMRSALSVEGPPPVRGAAGLSGWCRGDGPRNSPRVGSGARARAQRDRVAAWPLRRAGPVGSDGRGTTERTYRRSAPSPGWDTRNALPERYVLPTIRVTGAAGWADAEKRVRIIAVPARLKSVPGGKGDRARGLRACSRRRGEPGA
ncbi:hypothetical protein GCM10009839_58910 [Catenulispora yoronensis]|uniref:Uncharacterized protein n=1 Tax=Catenulispora yoronensis TaxID=450799 RepID=A0ABP5GPA4_9ACTN